MHNLDIPDFLRAENRSQEVQDQDAAIRARVMAQFHWDQEPKRVDSKPVVKQGVPRVSIRQSVPRHVVTSGVKRLRSGSAS